MTFASRQVHLTDECIGVILLGLPLTIKVRKTYCPIFLEIAEIYDIALIPSLAKPYTMYQQPDHSVHCKIILEKIIELNLRKFECLNWSFS